MIFEICAKENEIMRKILYKFCPPRDKYHVTRTRVKRITWHVPRDMCYVTTWHVRALTRKWRISEEHTILEIICWRLHAHLMTYLLKNLRILRNIGLHWFIKTTSQCSPMLLLQWLQWGGWVHNYTYIVHILNSGGQQLQYILAHCSQCIIANIINVSRWLLLLSKKKNNCYVLVSIVIILKQLN